MNGTSISNEASSEEAHIAEQLVRARLEARVLTQYPGTVPADFAAAYRIQDAGIARWPEPIGGWKVSIDLSKGWGEWGEERLIGPAFASSIRTAAQGQVIDVPVIGRSYPGVEAEVVVRVGRDAPPDKFDWTLDEAAEMVGEACIGVEVVSNALARSVECNLAALTSDFGWNFGIVIGKPIPNWYLLEEVAAQVFIDGQPAPHFHRGVLQLRTREGALGGLAFALGLCARRGHPLKAGAAIATGTVTGGLIGLAPGQTSRHVFEGLGEVQCHAVEAKPRN